MPFQVCPYCGKKTPLKNFCVHCGHNSSNITICPSCHTINPINTLFCPSCKYNFSSVMLNNQLKDSVQLNSIFTWFRLGILVIFLLSGYSLTQMMVGSVLLFVFPTNIFISSINQALLSLIVLIFSNTLLIIFLFKWNTFTLHPTPQERGFYSLILLLFLLLITSISIIEVVIAIVDFGLDLIHVDPTLASPYDEYFSTPLNLILFTILITVFGPIFEELIFRRYIISIILNQYHSKFLAVSTSALIFSLSHTAINIFRSVRYAILHLFATFILGIILAIIFVCWGLRYAIIFHSFWNIYSLIVQILVNDGSLQLVDQIISLFIIITLILTISLSFHSRRILSSLNPEVFLPPKTYLILFSLNIFLIITYVLILPLFLLSIPSNMLTAGLTFLYQVCAFIVSVIFIEKGKKKGYNNQLDLDAFYDDISSLK
ncbi:MAG: type II CAAX prenyl endopeptidase Rce1 family protein [Promethearchaeota archaeon]